MSVVSVVDGGAFEIFEGGQRVSRFHFPEAVEGDGKRKREASLSLRHLVTCGCLDDAPVAGQRCEDLAEG